MKPTASTVTLLPTAPVSDDREKRRATGCDGGVFVRRHASMDLCARRHGLRISSTKPSSTSPASTTWWRSYRRYAGRRLFIFNCAAARGYRRRGFGFTLPGALQFGRFVENAALTPFFDSPTGRYGYRFPNGSQFFASVPRGALTSGSVTLFFFGGTEVRLWFNAQNEGLPQRPDARRRRRLPF